MRGRLAKAAFEIIAERGHAAFRTAAVAARAGVSQGAQLHHFATKDDLVLAAIEYAFDRASRRTSTLIEDGFAHDGDPIALLIEDFRLFFMGDDFWVSLGITLDGAKSPVLAARIRPIVAQYRRPVYDRWVDLLSQAGWSRPDAVTIVRMTAALVSGFGVRTLWDNVDAYLDASLADWRRIIASTWPRNPRS